MIGIQPESNKRPRLSASSSSSSSSSSPQISFSISSPFFQHQAYFFSSPSPYHRRFSSASSSTPGDDTVMEEQIKKQRIEAHNGGAEEYAIAQRDALQSRLPPCCRVEIIPDNSCLRIYGMDLQLLPVETSIIRVLKECKARHSLNTTLRIAGGWVRDKLLKRKTTSEIDIDVAIDGMLGRELAELVNEHMKSVGMETKSVGVIQSNPEQSKHLETATMQICGQWVDLVNLRSESYSQHSRIPEMTFGTALEDAYRRDLTINALFYNLDDDCIEDYTMVGVLDLLDGHVRTPLPPLTTFLDDPLRVLRAVRFTSRYGFQMDEEILRAAKDERVQEALAVKVSRERLGVEMDNMMNGGPNTQPPLAIHMLCELGLYPLLAALPANHEPAVDYAAAEQRALYLTDALVTIIERIHADLSVDDRRILYLSSLLIPVSNAYYVDAKGKQFRGLHYVIKEGIKLRHKDSDDVSAVCDGVEPLMALAESLATGHFSRKEAGLLLRKIGPLWQCSLDLAAASSIFKAHSTSASSSASVSSGEANAELVDSTIEKFDALRRKIVDEQLIGVWELRPLLNGKEVLEMTKAKGPVVGEYMSRVLEWQLEDPARTAEECKIWLLELVASGVVVAPAAAASSSSKSSKK